MWGAEGWPWGAPGVWGRWSAVLRGARPWSGAPAFRMSGARISSDSFLPPTLLSQTGAPRLEGVCPVQGRPEWGRPQSIWGALLWCGPFRVGEGQDGDQHGGGARPSARAPGGPRAGEQGRVTGLREFCSVLAGASRPGFCRAPACSPSFLGGPMLRQRRAGSCCLGSSLGRGTGPSHRRESQARGRQAPAGRRPGRDRGPGCVWGGVSSISAAWVVSGTPGLGRGRPSRAHSPWRGLRNPALSLALPASLAGRRAAVFPWPHLERVTQGVGGRGPGCSRLPGERKHPLPAPTTAPPGLSPRKQDEACLGPARLSPAVGGRQNCAPTGRLGPPRELGGAGESILVGLVFLLPEAAAGNVVLQREACRAGGTVPGTQRGEFLV